MGVAVITVTRGTAVTVFFQFTKPTRASYPNVVQVPADPTNVKLVYKWTAGTETTWTYGGGQIGKLGTGLYVATLPTKTGPATIIEGKVIGTGIVTAVSQFAIRVTPTTT